MDPIQDQTQNQVACVNCQAVTTNDGRVVWVCENCGTENKIEEAPVAPDVTAAQAEIANAAAAVGAPMGSTPPVSPMAAVMPAPQVPPIASAPVVPPMADVIK